ncbi:BMP family ABC transporter substrate-binding protein [Clostridium sp. 'deep sea']|uniref:BMP family ABC transporter substrate-binding protein n=1 Tax=Clostridium sp. 'deep sea' TaxID=2779445 RepID=UPI0018967C84|nr:BMP family ABC transporter substrate-binding protein [Clostridium sp. 'deep sea']QOR35381.1 BMP family ABC transporter substrate-binding protein [Clostridium sp. 'deep sea']
MKKTLVLALLLSVLVFTVAGCTPKAEAPENQLKVALLIAGTLGDKSFFDAANKGLELVKTELNADTKVFEMGTDSTKWEPYFLDVIDGDYDVIISGNSTTELMNRLAGEYPEERFINFDTSITEHPDNVYSMFYSTNQLSFMAGVCAALVTDSNMELANEESTIGFLGGMDLPGINDFLVGYIEGAKYINPEIKMYISYAGDFADPAKGKELATIQYNAGADVVFSAAGKTGLGVIEAAKDSNKYALGVDSDQAEMFKDTAPEKADHIITSAVKYLDKAILRAVKKHVEGTLAYGTHEEMGLKENGVGLAKNEYYNNLLTDEAKAKIEEVEKAVTNGEITISSAFGMTTQEVKDIRDSVKPVN